MPPEHATSSSGDESAGSERLLRSLPADVRARALRLQPRPLAVFCLLVRESGADDDPDERSFVPAAKLAALAWPDLPVDATLNRLQQAIRKIRQTFEDDPRAPRIVETKPGSGYRYRGPRPAPETPVEPVAPAPRAIATSNADRLRIVALILVAAGLAAFTWRTIAVRDVVRELEFDFEDVRAELSRPEVHRLNPDDSNWDPDRRPGHLTLLTHQGDSWNEKRSGMPIRNMVGVALPEGNFYVTTRLTDFHPRYNWQQAGLLVGEDLDNYVRFDLSTALVGPEDDRRQEMRLGAVFELGDEVHAHRATPLRFRHDQHGVPNVNWRAEHGPVPELWLRIYHEDGVWSLKYSFNGTGWKDVTARDFPVAPRFVWLVAFHGIGTVGKQDFDWDPIPAHFDFLRVTPLRESLGVQNEVTRAGR